MKPKDVLLVGSGVLATGVTCQTMSACILVGAPTRGSADMLAKFPGARAE